MIVQQAPEDEKWVNLRHQEIIFEGEKCVLLSMRDVSSTHKLSKSKQEIELLKKLSTTISEDLIDPLSLIAVSVNWLIRWQKDNSPNEEVLENLYRILVASKMSLFKCKDLLEISSGMDTMQQSNTQFSLKKVTDEITDIVELQSRGKKVRVNVSYET